MSHKHFQTPKITHPGERRSPLLWLLVLLALVVVPAWFAYQFGLQQSGSYGQPGAAGQGGISQRMRALQDELGRQRELAARFERASQIDRLAADEVREELTILQKERADLLKKVALLDSLVSGEVTALQVSQVELSQEGEGSSYRFSFLVSKRAKGDEKVRGRVRLAVAGEIGGEQSTLSATKLGMPEGMKMGFRHFQKFEGSLQLPEGFVPSELVVLGEPVNKNFKSFEHRVQWGSS